MSTNKKIPNLNLTAEEIAKALKNIKTEDLLPPQDKRPVTTFYLCNHCQDQRVIQVYGPGPNMPCPVCGPRY